MQTGDIIFVRGKSPISRIIRYFDQGDFSHVSIAVSPYHIWEIDWYKKGDIVPFHYQDYSYELISFDFTVQEQLKIIEMCINMVGVGYDFKQLVWYLLEKAFKFEGKNLMNNPNKLICVEGIERILYSLGRINKEDAQYGRTPNELYRLLRAIP